MGKGKKGVFNRMTLAAGLSMPFLAGAVRLPAQSSVEARLAALEARIQELESQLAAARGGAPEDPLEPVGAVGATLHGAYIRPAVLTSPGGLPMSSSPAVAPSATLSPPPPQAGTQDFSGDFERLNFFKNVSYLTDFDYGMDHLVADDLDTVGSHAHWVGVASYLRFAAGNFACTPRLEYFNAPQRGQIRSYVTFARLSSNEHLIEKEKV